MKYNKNKFEPLWKEWDYRAHKKGVRNTIYSVNGDEYTGEWDNDKRDGKGIYKFKLTGDIYEGDWQGGKRSGFGTYSVRNKDGVYVKKYSGGWKNDKKQGFGTMFYSDEEYYEGEWSGNKRSGYGRMYYNDGGIYEGEWFNDMRNGQGMLRLENDNRYEGYWKDDMKHGKGKFYFLDKGHMYDGTWVKDIAKCGQVVDFDREEATDPAMFALPENTLKDIAGVLMDAEEQHSKEI